MVIKSNECLLNRLLSENIYMYIYCSMSELSGNNKLNIEIVFGVPDSNDKRLCKIGPATLNEQRG